jgi:branched-chain amino acid transport system ATP-binding protein
MADGGLKVSDLVVHRGGRLVLQGVSLDLRPGEITCLLGANGAGKSSLVTTMAGALPATSGSVALDGVELLGKAPEEVRRQGVAIVPEGHPLLTSLSVLDNLRAAGLMHRRPEAEREVASALALFPELAERRGIAAHFLSGGQKQMVAIAQALIARPRFLLVDELSFGLAPAIVSRLGETIAGIAATGVGILLIEQFTTLALALSSHAYVMERGEIAFAGSPDELRRNPAILHGAYLAAGKAAGEQAAR